MGIFQPCQRAGIKFTGGEATSTTTPRRGALKIARSKYAVRPSDMTTSD